MLTHQEFEALLRRSSEQESEEGVLDQMGVHIQSDCVECASVRKQLKDPAYRQHMEGTVQLAMLMSGYPADMKPTDAQEQDILVGAYLGELIATGK